MLTILLDPAGITGRQRYALDASISLQANIARHLAAGGDCELRINGQPVDPFTDPRLDLPPAPGDDVVVARRPAGFDPLTWVLVAVAASTAVLYALIPKMPGSAVGKDSPNNSLTGQSNVARAYQAVPDVYGYRRVWPDLIQPSTVEYIGNIKYVTEWLCISRGLGTISAVQYAETPIADIAGASYEVFEPVPADGYPEFGATTVADVIETFPSDEVNGQELPYPQDALTGDVAATSGATTYTITVTDTPALAALKSAAPDGVVGVEFSYGAGPTDFSESCTLLSYSVGGGNCVFTFSSTAWPATVSESDAAITFAVGDAGLTTQGPFTLPVESDRLRWNTVFLRGLRGSVVVRAEWWRIDADGVEVPGTREHVDTTHKDNSYDQRFFTTEATPAAGRGRYQVQFKRTTAKIGDGGTDVAKLEEVYAVRHYPQKVLPGVTVIRVTTKATTEATGFSDRKFNLRWQRKVRELGSATLSESRNFARAMAHIWTVAGNDIAGLDVDALQAVNAELGETSPLLRFDGSLDDADMSLGERLQLVANTARCVVWRDGLRWTITRDQARPWPELQLDYRNLAARGESAISYAAHLPASNDGVEVEYVDEATQSKKAYVRLNISLGVPVAGISDNPRKIKMPGCATLAQANNRAQLEARRLLYQRVSVADTALADGLALYPGALVRWVDPNDFGGDEGDLQAGEVMAINRDTITTTTVTVEATEAVLLAGTSDNDLMGTLATTSASYPDDEAFVHAVYVDDAGDAYFYVASAAAARCIKITAAGVASFVSSITYNRGDIRSKGQTDELASLGYINSGSGVYTFALYTGTAGATASKVVTTVSNGFSITPVWVLRAGVMYTCAERGGGSAVKTIWRFAAGATTPGASYSPAYWCQSLAAGTDYLYALQDSTTPGATDLIYVIDATTMTLVDIIDSPYAATAQSTGRVMVNEDNELFYARGSGAGTNAWWKRSGSAWVLVSSDLGSADPNNNVGGFTSQTAIKGNTFYVARLNTGTHSAVLYRCVARMTASTEVVRSEVTTVGGEVITTSEAIDWKGQASGRVLFTGADGRHLGPPVVCYPTDDGRVRLASLPAGLFVADTDRQLGSRYALAIGLTEAELEASGLYTVTEAKPGADRTVSLALAAYDARMYELD